MGVSGLWDCRCELHHHLMDWGQEGNSAVIEYLGNLCVEGKRARQHGL
jgi:hypothetical protein